MKIGIIRERKTPPDFRVPLTPEQCRLLKEQYPGIEIMAESFPDRCYEDEEYAAQGIPIVQDVHACDILMGVKEVPVGQLIHGKTYLFFSHTIKKQAHNRKLLQACIQKQIRLIDYETLKDASAKRIIGFGRFAGIVGAYNGFLGWGLKKGAYKLKPAHQCFDLVEVYKELKKVTLPPVKILLTGSGKVGNGAREIISGLQIKEVSPEDFIHQDYQQPVFTHVDYPGYNRHKEGKPFDKIEFKSNPERFESDFGKFLPVTDLLLAGHFWSNTAPRFFTREDMQDPRFKIAVIADISCDIDGPIPSTLRASTIHDPFYGYDPATGEETTPFEAGAVTIMAVDNLPCELPRDASKDFGKVLLEKVLPLLWSKEEEEIIERATICKNGTLTPYFSYLKEYAEGFA